MSFDGAPTRCRPRATRKPGRGVRVGGLPATLAALVGLAVAAGSAAGSGGGRCAWGPITDVPAAQALLARWAAEVKLPPFDKERSGLGIEKSSVRVILRFAPGTLTVAWNLDAACEPTAVTSVASSDYHGPVVDETAVRRLVRSLRSVTSEERSGWETPFWWGMIPTLRRGALIAVLFGAAVWLFWRRGSAALKPRAIGKRLLGPLRGLPASGRLRLLGLLGIIALLPYHAPLAGKGAVLGWLEANTLALVGILPLFAFLWLVLAGSFGYGSASRADWPALLPVVLAFGLRVLYARHGVEGLELHFRWSNQLDRHSVIYTFYVTFLQSLGRDPFRMVLDANALVGALAALPLYLFVRQRTASPTAALFVATFYAAHPLLVQMAPTDAPYSLCFAAWFAGLVLLTAPDVGPRQLVGGATLLGIAATCRAEGALYLPASLLLVDVRALLGAVRRHAGAAAIGFGVLVGLLAVEVYCIFPGHFSGGASPPVDAFSIGAAIRAGLWSTDYNDPLIVALALVGAFAGVLHRRSRLGLGAALATLVVVWPFCTTTTGGYTNLHRLSPACALQIIAAGIGAAWLTGTRPYRLWQRHTASAAALLAALYLLVGHHHEIHDPIGLSDEFWMLRDHLAPGGVVESRCKLMWVGRNMDTDLHNFEQVLPGVEGLRCDQRDCVAAVARGGCFYYLRGLNCFHSDPPTTPECVERGRTPAGGYLDCIEPECVQLEKALRLQLIEQRTVDVHSVWNFEHGRPPDPHYPVTADIGLYRVLGVAGAAPDDSGRFDRSG